MNKTWDVTVCAKYGDDKSPFSVVVEAISEQEAIKKIQSAYANAVVESIVESEKSSLNVQGLYETLKGISPVNEKSKSDGTVSTDVKIEGQEELAKEVEVDEGGEVDIDDKKRRDEAVDDTKGTRTVIAKGIVDKAEADKLASIKKGKVVTDEEDPKKYMVLVSEQCVETKKPLHLCNTCGKTFRSDENICECKSTNTELLTMKKKEESVVKESKKEIKEGLMDDEYEAKADLSVTIEGGSGDIDVEHDVSVRVPFKLDIEYRRWGISDIFASFPKPITFVCTVVDISGEDDVRKEIDVTIEPDIIKIEKTNSNESGFTIRELEVRITADGKVKSAMAYVDGIR